jgi:hypothetical protein
MKSASFRVVAFCLLVLLSFSFSGIVFTASAALHPELEDSCCGPADQSGDPFSSCTIPDCPCFSCAILILSPPVTVDFLEVPTEFVFFQIPLLFPSDFIRPIDYPPEYV